MELLKKYFYSYLERLKNLLPLAFISLALGCFLNVSMLYVLRDNGGYDAEHIMLTSIASLNWAIVLSSILALIPLKRVRSVITWFLLIIVVLLFSVESFLIYVEKTPFTDGILTSILYTNPAETSNYLASVHLNNQVFYSFAYLVLILLIGGGLYKLMKRCKSTVFLLALLLIIPLYLNKVRPIVSLPGHFNQGQYKASSIVERIYYASLEAQRERESLKHLYQALQTTQKKLKYTINKDLGQHSFILIQGESLCGVFTSLYGYPIKTTPLLDKLKAEGNLYIFDDVFSSSGYTPTSIRNTFSYYLIGSDKEWIEYPLLTDIFNQLGYQTYWLSNQESRGFYLTPINIISEQTKEHFFLNSSSFHDLSHQIEYDEALLPYLKYRDIDYKADKFFEVIHLMGNHVNYSARFPASFKKFTTDDLTKTGIKVAKPEVLVDYLNSIYYNDWLVHEIITRYQNEKAIIVYLSDHGQTMFRDKNNPYHCTHSDDLLGRDIPFIVYLTNKMKSEHPELIETIQKAQHKAFMTDALPESLLGLIGVELDAYKERKTNLFSDDYDETRSRIIN